MITRQWVVLIMVFSIVGGMAFAVGAENAGSVPRMTKDELKSMVGTPDLLVVDVRQGQDWSASEFKIKGAERMDPEKISEWKTQLPKDKTIVLYCA